MHSSPVLPCPDHHVQIYLQIADPVITFKGQGQMTAKMKDRCFSLQVYKTQEVWGGDVWARVYVNKHSHHVSLNEKPLLLPHVTMGHGGKAANEITQHLR